MEFFLFVLFCMNSSEIAAAILVAIKREIIKNYKLNVASNENIVLYIYNPLVVIFSNILVGCPTFFWREATFCVS